MRDLSNWGFSRDIVVSVSLSGVPSVEHRSEAARTRRGVIYASIRDDGLALKTGLTRMTLWQRWSGTIRVIGAERDRLRLRENEWEDRDEWREFILGHSFAVWSKRPETHLIRYAGNLPGYEAELLEAEEEYLDAVLEPVVGKSLRLRGKL